ncbi:PhoX family protein [Streptomyces sp. NPDC096310]|uniref:PhoX family protein n=1 Tax=Streptomyces sp. NPDC096310 TaxID=3366082 RepID=UPI00382FE645
MRKLLPLLSSPSSPHPGGRSALTCRYRCGDACFHEVPNKSDNEYVGDVIAGALSRRSMMRAAAVVTVAGAAGSALALGGPGGSTAVAAPAVGNGHAGTNGGGSAATGDGARGLRFNPVAPNTADKVTIPAGHSQNVVIRWGDPILRGAPAFNPDKQTAKAQAGQFGYNNDFLSLLPMTGKGEQGRQLLVANHEYTDEILMFKGYDPAKPTREQVEIAWAAHGLSVVVVEEDRKSGKLTAVTRHQLNRRITVKSEFRLTGPAAGSELLRTSADRTGSKVYGTLNNCAGGTTPWGTTLHGEENFNQYFANGSSPTDLRYGIGTGASERKWELFDKRFDLKQEPNEAHRFGWVVELDPYDPDSTPRKRTALGRFKHEAAQPRLTADGRPVVYMGDDERFDYLYKFVSSKKMKKGGGRAAHEHNLTLLDEGTLYVAKLTGDSPAGEIDGSGKLPNDGEFDGSGVWIPLATGDVSHVPGMSADEVYVFTRLAGDKVGATKMDRPEDVEPSPRTGRVYVALTNNTDRGKAGKAGPDEANPRNANKHGHILELAENWDDAAGDGFAWRLFLVAGDPKDPGTYFAGFPKDKVSPISCPDNVAFDPHGNLWISTDGNALGNHDGLFGVATQGERRGELKQFLTMPNGAETCGPVIQDRRVLVAVQHPGEIDGASVEKPASTWPDGPGKIVRPSVISVWRNDGRDIGV